MTVVVCQTGEEMRQEGKRRNTYYFIVLNGVNRTYVLACGIGE